MIDLEVRLRELSKRGSPHLPYPGRGSTAVRHLSLATYGREDLSLARMVEAHTDAAAILSESGAPLQDGKLYGVWASDGPQSRVTATALSDGSWKLEGTKQYCSGSTIVDAALVTAWADGSIMLFDVPLDAPGVAARPSTWTSTAFDDTATAAVAFEGVHLEASAAVGGPGWYLSRPGFWHGAIGPAACWAGGAMYLIDAATKLAKKDAHSRAQLGALLSIGWGLEALLTQAGHEIDADPADTDAVARTRALKVRHLVERWCTETMDRFGRATGPQLLAFDPTAARQHTALALYIRQCHAERDLETIPANAQGSNQ